MGSQEKHQTIRSLLRNDAIWQESDSCYNCLPPDLRERFDIVETARVSEHEYDLHALELIKRIKSGWILDCGAGARSDYHPNVVNYEIVNYASTDVLGVAEDMPFEDGVFDGVICLNVLEHVKDPFKSANEIVRVLKPGGKLYCVVPFLQPYHGYPHHYYNMTAQGLQNLFFGSLEIDGQLMLTSGLPIWSLSWVLKSWRDGLPEAVRKRFVEMTVAELACEPLDQLDKPYVTELPNSKNFELASTTAVLATKPITVSLMEKARHDAYRSQNSRLEQLIDHFLKIEKHYQRELAGGRMEKQSLETAISVARQERQSLGEELAGGIRENYGLQQKLKIVRQEMKIVEGELATERNRLSEQNQLLEERDALIADLDRRLNVIRRSRFWRWRRRLVRLFGIDDKKD